MVDADGAVSFEQLPADAVPVHWEDVSKMTSEQVVLHVEKYAKRPFVLGDSPGFRCGVFTVSVNEHILLLNLHHIVIDGRSAPLLLNKLLSAYSSALCGSLSQPSPQTKLYRDFIDWERNYLESEQCARDRQFWLNALAEDLNDLRLPWDQEFRGESARRACQTVVRTVPEMLTKAIRELARRCGVSSAAVFLSIFKILLYKYSGEKRLHVGMPSMHRPEARFDGLIGCYVNMLPIRTRVDPARTVEQYLLDVQIALADALDHAAYPYTRMVRDKQIQQSTRRQSPLQVAYGFQNAQLMTVGVGVESVATEISVEPVTYVHQDTEHELLLEVIEKATTFDVNIKFDDRIPAENIDRLLGHFFTLADSVSRDSSTSIASLSTLTPAERQFLNAASRGDSMESPAMLLHDLVEAQCRLSPDAIALHRAEEAVSYSALSRRADSLAQVLRAIEGVGSDSHVAVCVEQGPAMVVAWLGVLKAGAAFVAIDPELPDARIANVFAQCCPRAVVVAADGSGNRYASYGAQVVALGHVPDSLGTALNTAGKPQSSSLAYTVFTSGSTGIPKGVCVEHRHIGNLLQALKRDYDLRADDRVLQFVSPSFDVAIQEVFTALLGGASLVFRSRDWLSSASGFWDRCQRTGITVAHLPASFWQQLIHLHDTLPECIRLLVIGGEAIQAESLARWFRLKRRPRLVNQYGPSETTVTATMHSLRADSRPRCIGRPLPNVCTYVLSPEGQIVPIGVTGELYIAGGGLARGYLNDPALTETKFLRLQLEGVNNYVYRTGDLVRWLSDGTLEYLGRADNQVKVRGFRVELGEVESALCQIPSVTESHVVLLEETPGEKRLVAYVGTDNRNQIDTGTLREELRHQLPDYMIPSAFVVLATLPRGASGKVDRSALPLPDHGAGCSFESAGPTIGIESELATLWREALSVNRLLRTDDFFHLGGDSLLAVRIGEQIRLRWAVELPYADLFAYPTLVALAERVSALIAEREISEQQDIEIVDRCGAMPASFAQQRLWFIAQLDAEAGAAYHIPLAILLKGALNRRALEEALRRILVRHETLRTGFVRSASTVQQVIVSNGSDFGLAYEEYSGGGNTIVERALEEFKKPFDLEAGPLMRARLLRLDECTYALLVTIHHIVSDGWSMGIFMRELGVQYEAASAAQPDPLPPLPIQYADFAAWQRRWFNEERQQEQLSYWVQQLTGAPPWLSLPTDRLRPMAQSYSGSSVPVCLGTEITQALVSLSKAQGITLYMAVLASWAMLLARLSGETDIVIGSPTASRRRIETEDMIGFLINSLPLRIRCETHMSVTALLTLVKSVVLEAQHHQAVPFERVVEVVSPDRSLARSPIFQVLFAWQNLPKAELVLPGLAVSTIDVPCVTSQFDLSLSLQHVGGQICGSLTYATALFDESTIRQHLDCWEGVLRAMTVDADQNIWQLALLSADERLRIVRHWNEPLIHFERLECVHQKFEEVVSRYPDRTAISFQGQHVTYADLNRRANQLAWRLRSMGVKPDALVAVCVERGVDMIVALVATLKAGGAYVPVDPATPPERLAFVLQDSQPTVLITSHTAGLLAAVDLNVQTIFVEEHSKWALERDTNPGFDEVGISEENLCYVIYTSGSTGQPKGVLVEHRNVARLFAATDAWFGFGENDVWTQCHSFAFDFSVWEIWGALLFGGRLVIVPLPVTRAPEQLSALICTEGVTVLSQTPTAFIQLISATKIAEVPHQLRLVVFGGEALEPSLLAPWFECEKNSRTQLVNMYGITETTVHVTYRPITQQDCIRGARSPIGIRIPDLSLYVLDHRMTPVPVGVDGELYVGGAGVARGYLNRKELTSKRFLENPFASNDRLYRTGDLVRWIGPGELEYVGRNDTQIKLRGFRIELGEIEAQLATHPLIKDVRVMLREIGSSKSLVAYIIPLQQGNSAAALSLRDFLASRIPEHMIPAAFVELEAWPLTINGKLDTRDLPLPQESAFARAEFEAPVGAKENLIAAAWCALLGAERVGRQDNFFSLGGHSLLTVQLIDRLHQQGLHAEVRSVFLAPTLKELAACIIERQESAYRTPRNMIPAGACHIAPEMVPLASLSEADIQTICATVEGGAENVQDIYPLAPLQEGILFHHLMNEEGDPYLLHFTLSFDTQDRRQRFLEGLQAVIDRHDILRTAFVWERIFEPVQVVWRRARLKVENIELRAEQGAALDQLRAHVDPRRFRLDIRRAPVMYALTTQDPHSGRYLLSLFNHHLIDDQTTLKRILVEVQAHVLGVANQLPDPLPFRDFVAFAKFGVSVAAHELYFKEALNGVDGPTAPYGILEVHHDGSKVRGIRRTLASALARRLRESARALNVSPASFMHLAWAQVLALTCGREDVVFGTVLFGRAHSGVGADRALGLFINTLPIRIDVGNDAVVDGIRKTHRTLAELLHHEHAALALAQRASDVLPPLPLFTTLLNYRHSEASTEAFLLASNAWDGMEVLHGEDGTNYPITVSVDDLGEEFQLTVQVIESLDPDRLCGYLEVALEQIVCALQTDPLAPLHSLRHLSEHDFVLEPVSTGCEQLVDVCVHELFETQVLETPDRVALSCRDGELTYAQLNVLSDRLAAHLRSAGIGPGALVTLFLDRTPALIVAVIATLKAGAAYVPLDLSFPVDRLKRMIEEVSPNALLATSSMDRIVREIAPRTVRLWLDDRGNIESSSTLALTHLFLRRRPHLSPATSAYVLFTSGSTGVPKGVTMPHGPLVRLIEWHRQTFANEPAPRVLQFAPIGFDVSFQEIFTTLCVGGTLVLIDNATRMDPAALGAVIQSNCVDRVFLPFVALQQFTRLMTERHFLAPTLRHVIVAGEQLRIDAPIIQFFQLHPQCRLHNHYGPTETHVVTSLTLQGAPETWPALPSIGKPLPHCRIYILDKRHQPVPKGVVGEIYIGGDCIATGYLNSPSLTAGRFLKDPFTDRDDAAMYRTGDLGRWTDEGAIEFLGRNDSQIKHRGFRIELSEIDVALETHARVEKATTMMREDTPGKSVLVSYFLSRGPERPSAAELREYLQGLLPEYMVPSAVVWLETLPLTASGKLNKRALPEPDFEAYDRKTYQAPDGDIEHYLATVWQDLLGVERVGRNDNFFALGGHSLLIVQLIERLRRIGLRAHARDVFAAGTLRAMAHTLAREESAGEQSTTAFPLGCVAITPEMLTLGTLTQEEIDDLCSNIVGGAANIADIYPLAPLQEGIFFEHMLAERGDAYTLNFVLRFATRGQVDDFLRALQFVVDRHDILRSSFHSAKLTRPIQVVWRHANLDLSECTVSGDMAEVLAQLHRVFNPRQDRLDLGHAPLIRTVVGAVCGDESCYLSLSLHHLICDHTTLEHVLGEVHKYLHGDQSSLPIPVPFKSFVAHARDGMHSAAHDEYFRQLLSGVDETTAPFGIVDAHSDGVRAVSAHLSLPRDLSARLRRAARELNVSAATIFHIAFGRLVASTSARTDVVFGTVVIGRMSAGHDAHRTLGLFINTLPVRLRVDQRSVVAAVRDTHSQLAELMQHEHAPLATVQRASEVPAPAPLFTALMNYRHSQQRQIPKERSHNELWTGVSVCHVEDRTSYALTCNVDDLGEDYAVTLQSLPPGEPARLCEYLATALENLVTALEHEPRRAFGSLGVLSRRDWEEVVLQRNLTAAAFPADRCLHELIEDQVARTPDAVALRFGDVDLTYTQLNEQANRLAHALVSLGVKPDQPVIVLLERSAAMVAALLGILKSGGAYVPLDLGAPDSRLGELIKDISPGVILTNSVHVHRLAQWHQLFLSVDDGDRLNVCASTNLSRNQLQLTSHHLAYVIYTSGSTGQPKGAMNEHRAVVNRLWWMQAHYRIGAADHVLLKTPVTFDVSVWELFLPLIVGARLVVARPDGHRDPQYLAELIRKERVTIAHFVPSMLQSFLADSSVGTCSSLKQIICSGEVLSPHLVHKLLNLLPMARVDNLYGPTEAAVDVTSWQCSGRELARVPIGRPISNVTMYILDEWLNPVPQGAVGRIYIGGVAVGRGYWNRVELTKLRFIEDQFSGAQGAKLYDTGDLGSWRPDGAIEFLGRKDGQVKLRGVRIEVGEVEAELRNANGIRDVAVVLGEARGGEQALIAYFVGVEPAVNADSLRQHLLLRLPEVMVPTAFVQLAALPLTASGKLNRRVLPAPEEGAYSQQQFLAPETPAECAVAKIWAELLGAPEIGLNDNFYALGGHSLLIVQMIEMLRRQGYHVDARTIFSAHSLASLAVRLTPVSHLNVDVPPNRISADCTRITPDLLTLIDLGQAAIDRIVEKSPGGTQNIQDIYPLGPLQRGILFHHQLHADTDPYVLSAILRFSSRDRVDEFLDAWQKVIDRHDILRTAFHWEGLDEPVQVVLRAATMPIRHVPPSEMESRGVGALEVLRAEVDSQRAPFEMHNAPLMRAVIASDKANNLELLSISYHHLICDHSTIERIFSEVKRFLAGARELPTSTPFRRFVHRARVRVRLANHEPFFRRMLVGFEEPSAPYGILSVQGDGRSIDEVRRPLGQELSSKLRELARAFSVSPACLMHLAVARVIARTSGKADVAFGTVLLGRMDAIESGDPLGLTLNTLPLRIETGDCSVREGVARIQQLLADLVAHEQVPLSDVQRLASVPSGTPLFTCLLNYRHSRLDYSVPNDVSTVPEPEVLHVSEATNYPVTFNIDDLGEDFLVTVQVARGIYAGRLCAYVDEALRQIATALSAAPDSDLAAIDVLPSSERSQLQDMWNPAPQPRPPDARVDTLVAEQMAKTPDATCLWYAGRSLSYAELDWESDRLARLLQAEGVAPESVVAICLPPSINRVIATVAVLKAGGACLPLDIGLPEDRLAYMVSEVPVVLLLTERDLLNRLPSSVTSRLRCICESDWATAGPSVDPIEVSASPDNLAFIIYTSASTGMPKAVGLTHSAVVNRLLAQRELLPLSEGDVCIHKTAFGFVDAIVEVFDPLTTGHTLVVAPESATLDPSALISLVERAGVTRLLTVPSLARAIAAIPVALHSLQRLRTWSLSGETLTGDLFSRLQRLLPACRFLNWYGSTEVTADATAISLEPEHADIVPIGRPLPNTEVYVVDGRLSPVPIGALGEICVGGSGLARCYLNQPELTRERFISSPFRKNSRLFRTGDLGWLDADGVLHFSGRKGTQVKIRGIRVELAEIEMQLREHDSVCDAAVILSDASSPQLTAYIVPRDVTVDLTALKGHLKRSLPRYMVPARWTIIEALPLTASGKLDRRALPALGSFVHESPTGALPITDTEKVLAKIWSDLLERQCQDIDEEFTDAGGHSLLATRLTSDIEQTFGLRLPLRIVLDLQTIRSIAGYVDANLGDAGRKSVASIAFQALPGKAALSALQMAIWRWQQQLTRLGNALGVIQIDGVLSVDTLAQALHGLAHRHDVLRYVVCESGGKGVELVQSEQQQIQLELSDLSVLGSAECSKALAEEMQQARYMVRDGALSLNLKARLLRLRDDSHVLLLKANPLAVDEWSLNLLTRELAVIYGAVTSCQPIPLPDVAVHFADYVIGEESRAQGQIASGSSDPQAALFGFPWLNFKGAGEPRRINVEPFEDIFDFELARPILPLIKRLALSTGTSLYSVLLSAFSLVLSRLSGSEVVGVGTLLSGRQHWRAREIVGPFAEWRIVSTEIDLTSSFKELLRAAHERVISAAKSPPLPYQTLRERMLSANGGAGLGAIQIEFNFGSGPQAYEAGGARFELADCSGGLERPELALRLHETADHRLIGRMRDIELQFQPSWMEQFLDTYQSVLQLVAVGSDATLGELWSLAAKTDYALHSFGDGRNQAVNRTGSV